MQRRQLIKVGLIGAAVLGTVSLFTARPWEPSAAANGATDASAPPPVPPQPHTLLAWSHEAQALIGAVALVVLGPACTGSEQDRQRAVEGVKVAVSRLSPSAQREVGELLSLLTFAPARALAAGIWTDWQHACGPDVAAFLQRWRTSRLGLLQSGYHALHDLILGSWYADPQSWAGIGYPGPPLVGTPLDRGAA